VYYLFLPDGFHEGGPGPESQRGEKHEKYSYVLTEKQSLYYKRAWEGGQARNRQETFITIKFFLTINCFCDINFLYNEVYTNGIEYNTGEQKGDGADCTEKFPG
jgi:hypothetical protein